MIKCRGNLTGRSAKLSLTIHSRCRLNFVPWLLVCIESDTRIRGYTQARAITMQGRAGKAPKREMVIESPQQYKCLAEIEAEVEAGSQVAAVSALRVIFHPDVFCRLVMGVALKKALLVI